MYDDLTPEKLDLLISQNDRFRTEGETNKIPGMVELSEEIRKLPIADQKTIKQSVKEYNMFNHELDPYLAHDFGFFLFGNKAVFWKIEYFDNGMTRPSPNKFDPDKTFRVLTVAFTSEYRS